MTPEVTLAVECQMTNPPVPVGIAVLNGNEPIAFFKLDELRRIIGEVARLDAATRIKKGAAN